MQGDSGNLFFLGDSNKDGHDILNGQGGDDDYDMEDGDDIGLGGPGIEKVAGAGGYDWEVGQGDPQPTNMDLNLPLVGLDVLTVDVRDKFNEVEALSGWKFNDTLRGDDLVPSAVGGAGFVGCDVLDQRGIDRIHGLGALVTPLGDLAPVVASSASGTCQQRGPIWGAGNILLGGAGSDAIEGRGGDDIIDGDRYLSVRLSVRTNPADPNTEIGSAGVEAPGQSAMNSRYLRDANGNLTGPTLQQAVFNGTVDPGNIVAVREILTANNPGDKDTAVYSDTRASYQCTDLSGATPQPLAECPRIWTGGKLEVSHLGGDGVVGGGAAALANDGTDIVENVEELFFSDSAPPAAPTGVTATAGNANAQVGWLPSASPVDSYEVQVLDSNGAQVGALRELVGPPDINIGLLVQGLTNRQTYTFRVRGVNAFGSGDWSLPSNAVTPHANLPAAPGAPNVVPGNHHVEVSWTEPANGGAIITGYEVHVADANGPVGAPRLTTDTTLDVTGLTNGRRYFFSVLAINEEGPGPVSPAVAAVPRTRPGAPHITGLTPRNHGAMVRWAAPADDGGSAITGYRIQVLDVDGRQVGALRQADALTNRLLVNGLQNGRSYTVSVRARNDAGASPWSSAMKVRPHA